MADPKKGTGKKPKGSGRRLYTDENPKDTVSIAFATVQDARDTVRKVKNIKKPFARKIQILTVLEQRAKAAGKKQQAQIAKQGKESIRRKHGRTNTAKKRNKRYLNKVEEVLVEGINLKDPNQVMGRTRTNRLTFFNSRDRKGNLFKEGDLVRVEIKEIRSFSLTGYPIEIS